MKVWQLLLLLAGGCAVGALILLAFNFVVLPRMIHRNTVILMPDLRGLDVAAAEQRVAELGLRVVAERTKPHPEVAEGRILEQVPEPRAPIRRGRVVRVVTSSGPPAGELPDLTGLTLHQTEVTLQREAYRLGRVLHLRAPDVAAPVVALQRPAPGRRLRKGAEVDVVVAEPGPPVYLRVPDLRGAPLHLARQAVAAADCVLAPVTYERTSEHPPQIVLSQAPPPGCRVEKGARIELVASAR
jgi:serine/threonine-protein kinase